MKWLFCFFGFHKWKYGRNLYDGGINRPRIARRKRECENCGKYQELKAAPPNYSLPVEHHRWATIKKEV